MPYEPLPELADLSLSEIAELAAARRLPPLNAWHPAATVDSHMVIRGDGRWYHRGGEITRPAMIRAFASLLMRDAEGAYWLYTPHERQSIEVEDAPFVAVDVVRKDDALVFRLNTDEIVVAGPDTPLRAAGTAEVPALYLMVRNGCEARLNRSTYLQLADMAGGDDWTVHSKGIAFSLVPR